MDNIFLETAINIDNILQKGDLKLIDDFEREFIKLEYNQETTVMIVYGNRDVIRKCYKLAIYNYGSRTTLYEIRRLLHNYNDECRVAAIQLTKGSYDINEYKRRDELATFFLLNYLGISRGGRLSDEFTYSKPLRYLVDKLIDTCENNDYYPVREIIQEKKKVDEVKEIKYWEDLKDIDLLINISSGEEFQDKEIKTIENELQEVDIEIYESEDNEDWLDFDYLESVDIYNSVENFF